MVFNLRLLKIDQTIDTQNTSNRIVNFGVYGDTGVFNSGTNFPNSLAQSYRLGNIISDNDITLDLAGDFTIAFWAKFAFDSKFDRTVTDKYFILTFEDGTTTMFTVPQSKFENTDTDIKKNLGYDYITITRSSGTINLYMNGNLIDTATNTAELNLTNTSSLFIGDPYADTYNSICRTYIDDLLIEDTVDTDFTKAGTANTVPATYFSNLDFVEPVIPVTVKEQGILPIYY